MKWFGAAVKVEQFDDGDRLRFRVTNERRFVDLAVPLLGGIGLFYAWHTDASWLVLIGFLALMGFPVWRWVQVRVTELRVTEAELVVEGDLNNAPGALWLPWSDVSGLQFLHGGEEEPAGLYALKGSWGGVCLVPNVSDAQAGEIIHAIYSRFPYVAMAEATETPSVLSKQSEPIALGLTGNSKD